MVPVRNRWLKRVKSGACLLFLASSLCCSEPAIRSNLVNVGTQDGWNGPIEFELDLADSMKVYELDLYLQFGPSLNEKDGGSLPLEFKFIAPDSSVYSDRCDFPLNIIDENRAYRNGVLSLFWPYRRGISVMKAGRWRIIVTPLIAEKEGIFRKIMAVGLAANEE